MPVYEAFVKIPEIDNHMCFVESDIESAKDRLKDLVDDLIDANIKCGVVVAKKK